MKYIILLLISFTIIAQETEFSPLPIRCWYSTNGSFCGDYKDDDPHVIANGECLVEETDYKKLESRSHLKLKANGKVECPPVVDNARKAQAEAAQAALEMAAQKKEDAKTWLKANENSLSPTEKKFKEALGL